MTPKIYIIPFDAASNSDPTVTRRLLDFLPNKVSSESQADVVLTVCSYRAGYKFNEALREVKKPLVVLDYLEMGWSAGEKENVLGRDALKQFGHLDTEDYAKLDQWVKDCPPALTLKRELFTRDASPTMKPAEWLVYLPSKPLQTREQFNARPIEVFSNWGLSHPMRPMLHGSIFTNAHNNNIFVADSFSQEQKIEGRCWFTVFSPWYVRTSMENIQRVQRRAKISVSLFGAGQKSFRDGESCVGSILARPHDALAWSYPWNHGENCIRLRPDHLFEDLLAATQKQDLFQIYEACQRNADNYRSENYAKNYVVKEIEKVI